MYVLFLMQSAGATLILMKCEFFTVIIEYLGHVNCPRHLELAPYSTVAICGLSFTNQRHVAVLITWLMQRLPTNCS